MRHKPLLSFLMLGLALLPISRIAADADEQVPLSPFDIPQFVDPLPDLAFADGTQPVTLTMCEFKAHVLPTGTFEPGVAPETWTWGYIVGTECPTTTRETYLGPVIVAQRGTPTLLTAVNDLGYASSTHVLAWKNSTDQTIHWADPLNKEQNGCSEERHEGEPPTGECAMHYDGPVPAVIHLHGGEVPPHLDGGPDAWFTSDGLYQGHAYYSYPGTGGPGSNMAVYRYPNGQEPAIIWFHDHVLGLTRLNVYAGLAGGYLITDPSDTSIPSNLPAPIPLIVQDRMFDKDGQLYFPSGEPFNPNPDHPYWVPEFTGDTIAVNGRVWPYLDVEPKRYRFLFINGSNARTYEMFLTDEVTKDKGPAMWQIGTDGGFLDTPVEIDPAGPGNQLRKLRMMPGERADVIVDFAGLAPGTRLILRNTAKTPYPAGDTVNGRTLGRVMQFRVVAGGGSDDTYDPAGGGALRSPMVRLVDPVAGTLASGIVVQKTRQLTLNEVIEPPVTVEGIEYEGGPEEVLVNNTMWDGTDPEGNVRPDFTPITVNGITTGYSELPKEGETEVWEIVNTTADAHPIHLHLVQFQLINRQNFDNRKFMQAYAEAYGGTIEYGFGPPNDYNVPNADGAVGGNPAVGRFLRGPARPPDANEAGWKDTVMMAPGQVTRIAVRWAPMSLPAGTDVPHAFYKFSPDGGHGYVWHCHIIDHEDNEMMRPTSVQANPSATRTYVEGTDY
ncbi:MAG TPA: multicopper oxidase domain-containing protein [Candidatus Saccharimonadales bacterium]|nr:multicopper oxidase domain-containing protein [Candidatus Saccharimonadales bacterium]